VTADPGAAKALTDVSFSRIRTYLDCPWKYHLVFAKGWRSGPDSSMALGVSLHRALAAFLDKGNTDRSVDRLLELYDANWVNEGAASVQETFEKYEYGRGLMEGFHRVQSGVRSDFVGAEMEFRMELDGLCFRGTIDRIDREADGTYSIIEYKTNGAAWTPERVATDLQMTLYALGAERALGYPTTRLRYWFLSTGELVDTTRTAEQKEKALALVKEVGHKVRAEEFPPLPASCPACEYARRCPKSAVRTSS
jgi:RecB family exonuclease